MPNVSSPRIALFTHDAYGLGHIRRCSHIIRELADRCPDSAILLITGSPAVDFLKFLPPNSDYVKIPTIVTSGEQKAKPPVLAVGIAELSSLRREIIRQTLATFAPDVLLVDNFPLGTRLELLPALQELRRCGTRMVLGLRDIVDPPNKVRSDWSREGMYDVLERYYDRILIYGIPEVLDVQDAYELPTMIGNRVHYCGYVTAKEFHLRSREEIQKELELTGPFILATVGGGGDGFPLLQTFLKSIATISGVSAVIVTGEFMNSLERAELHSLASDSPAVVVRDFVRDLPSYISASELVIAMGGYNTTAEILALKANAVIVPRTWRSGEHSNKGRTGGDAEQLVRAQSLANLGMLDFIHPDALSPDTLAQKIRTALLHPKRLINADTTGVDKVADHLLELAYGEAGNVCI